MYLVHVHGYPTFTRHIIILAQAAVHDAFLHKFTTSMLKPQPQPSCHLFRR